MKPINIILLLVFTTLISCNDKKQKSQKTIDVHNLKIEQGEKEGAKWVESPLLIATYLSRAGTVSSRGNIQFEKINTGERPVDVKIIIEEEGVLDHENPKTRISFHLKIIDGGWRVVE